MNEEQLMVINPVRKDHVRVPPLCGLHHMMVYYALLHVSKTPTHEDVKGGGGGPLAVIPFLNFSQKKVKEKKVKLLGRV